MFVEFLPFLTIAAVLGSSLAGSGGKDLILVHLMYRHGDRSPMTTFPTDPYQEASWPQGFRQLTLRGMNQHYKLGQYFRNRYINGFPYKLLNTSYKHNEIFVRSSDLDRTLMSAYSNLAGLFPPSPSEQFDRNILWQPIPVHTVPQMSDWLYGYPCAAISEFTNEIHQSEKARQLVEYNSEFLSFVANKTGMPTIASYDIARVVWNTLHCEMAHDAELPDWAKQTWPDGKTTFDKLAEMANVTDELRNEHPRLNRLQGGPFVKEMIANMMQKIDGSIVPHDRKLIVYSAHDNTIAAVTGVLHVFNKIVPPYTAALMVELFNSSGKYFVELWYRNDSTRDPYQLIVPGCSASCPVDMFVSLTKDSIPDDIRAECQLATEEGTTTKSVFAVSLAVFMIVLTVVAVGMFIVTLCRLRKERLAYRRLAYTDLD